jgi:glycosyltransferase involved in cell wall biosynthesis
VIKLLLHFQQISERGDSVNAETLSLALKKYYGIDTLITYQKSSENNNYKRINELRSLGLDLVAYKKPSDLHVIGRDFLATHSYFMNGGNYSPLWVRDTRKLTHAIFNNFEPHGDRYNYNSYWMYRKALSTRRRSTRDFTISKLMALHQSPYELDTKMLISWVPHIVETELGDGETFRLKYSISKSYLVVGRIGGFTEFNDSAAKIGVIELLEKNKDIFFVFVNTRKFYSHKRLIHIDYLSSEDKWDFYSAVDLLVNGRLMGESFGFSVCEALATGKPIIAPSSKRNRKMDKNHIKVIGDKELLYNSTIDFVKKVSTQLKFPKNPDQLKSKVDAFSAKEVSKLFYERFLI